MKTRIKAYFISIITLLIFTFLFSLILTTLNNKQIITNDNALIALNVLTYTLLAIISFTLSYKLKKHGWVNALFLSMLIIIISLITHLDFTSLSNILRLSSKILTIFIFSILGVNRSLK